MMFIKKENYDAINADNIERIYIRKDIVEEGDKANEQYAVVAEIYLKPTEGSEGHYHAERISSHATLEAAQEEFDDWLDILNG